MSDARAIRAAFTEYKMVKTRSTLQLIVEVPLEQQADVFSKLGYPLPGSEKWVAIALLDPAIVPVGPAPEATNEVVPQEHSGAAATEMHPGGAYRSVSVVEQAVLPKAEPAPGACLARSQAGRERYRAADDMERAVMRAGTLVSDLRFQKWAADKSNLPLSIDLAKSYLRAHCAINSRKELAMSERAYEAFLELETTFRMETGQTAEIR